MAPTGLDIEKRLDRIEAQGKASSDGWMSVEPRDFTDFTGKTQGFLGENHGILGDFIVREVGSNNSDHLASLIWLETNL